MIGSGPIRIGQGIEFDYCSVRSAMELREARVNSIMVNSNPETVSTDFDASSRLYFEPLDEESVRDILENETVEPGRGTELRCSDSALGVIVQFGGQTAINLAEPLERAGATILGSGVEAIDLAEDRRRFERLPERAGHPPAAGGRGHHPGGGADDGPDHRLPGAYPALLRPGRPGDGDRPQRQRDGALLSRRPWSSPASAPS